MKKFKLALSLAMLIAIPANTSFADTKTKFAPIVDASQMDMTVINGLKPVKIGGGGFSPSIGSEELAVCSSTTSQHCVKLTHHKSVLTGRNTHYRSL